MSAMLRRVASVLCALSLAATLVPALALADGDPASDVLLGENVFYPYAPPVSAALQRQLNAETTAAHRAGFPIKVALIAGPTDLGVIPDLFGKPQPYAEFLDREISFRAIQPLLVVMPSGYGVDGVTGPAKLAVGALPKPAGKTSDALAQAAVTAVAKLSAASGHKLPGDAGAGGTSSANSGGSSSTPIVIGLVVAAVIVAGALIALRRRQAPAGPGGS
jgi:hypothetical protein